MKEKIDFSKCPHYNDPNCPGLIRKNGTGSLNNFVVDHNGKNFITSDMPDFIKKHGCSECPRNNN